MTAMPPDLIALPANELLERLCGYVRRARRLAIEGNDVEVHDLLKEVSSAASEAEGARFDMLQLAEAALRTAARSDLGRSELALRRFFVEHPEEADAIFEVLLAPNPIAADHAAIADSDVSAALDRLASLGVLSVGKAGYQLRASYRAVALDLHEPMAFRMWRQVEHARNLIAHSRLSEGAAATYVAAHLGVTEPQARRFLMRSPLPTAPSHSTSDEEWAVSEAPSQTPTSERFPSMTRASATQSTSMGSLLSATRVPPQGWLAASSFSSATLKAS